MSTSRHRQLYCDCGTKAVVRLGNADVCARCHAIDAKAKRPHSTGRGDVRGAVYYTLFGAHKKPCY